VEEPVQLCNDLPQFYACAFRMYYYAGRV